MHYTLFNDRHVGAWNINFLTERVPLSFQSGGGLWIIYVFQLLSTIMCVYVWVSVVYVRRTCLMPALFHRCVYMLNILGQSRNVIFGLREPCTIKNWRLLNIFENSIFTVKWVIFPIFLAIFQYNFGDSWDNHGMWPIILGYFFQQLQWK